MKIALAGAGAFGVKHLDAINNIEGVSVHCLVDPELSKANKIAQLYSVRHVRASLAEALLITEIDAVILCSPTGLHAEQALLCMHAGKHVQVEIPVADNVKDALEIAKLQSKTGLVCMVGHTRRYNPSHQWLHNSIVNGERSIQQMDVQTYFFRRTNINAKGEPRSWTDNLLWHHAAHTVDLFQYQTGESIVVANAIQGPSHPTLGVPTDMSIQLKTTSGKICTLSLSFNNDGPLGSFFRYICDNGTFIARYDELMNGQEEPIDVSHVDVSLNGIELQNRDFFTAIGTGTEPRASIANVLACYQTLHELEQSLANGARA
ncbi:MAG: Gfo/Idh/MocA family oxidoreductase [Proteobacteria bacterium]|nr:Gfo/Idh/MocA family oxidoreductase [Pseudomonadota bacterium]